MGHLLKDRHYDDCSDSSPKSKAGKSKQDREHQISVNLGSKQDREKQVSLEDSSSHLMAMPHVTDNEGDDDMEKMETTHAVTCTLHSHKKEPVSTLPLMTGGEKRFLLSKLLLNHLKRSLTQWIELKKERRRRLMYRRWKNLLHPNLNLHNTLRMISLTTHMGNHSRMMLGMNF